MLDRLLPKTADNAFCGHWTALWLMGATLLLKLVIGLRSMFDSANVAQAADGIPLDTFPPAAAHEVVSIFSLLGLQQVTLALVCIVVLARYRTLVTLMFAILLIERLGRTALLTFRPGAPTDPHAPGQYVGLSLLVVIIAGLTLCFWPRRAKAPLAP